MATAVQTPVEHHAHKLPTYEQVQETTHDLDWADLVTLDLSTFDQPGGKKALSKQLFSALQTIGFFYITNFGLSQEQIDEQFAIGKSVFELPEEEKLKYRADLENGGYNGYKPMGLREMKPGIRDNTEIYNIPKLIPSIPCEHPEIINENIKNITHFSRHIHNDIVHKLLVLFALVLELPEDHFTKHHSYDESISDCHLRYMKYHARTPEQNQQLENVWVKGHTDFGSLTLLFRQPVAALQVRSPEGGWKWVRPLDGSITVNVADALQFLTNGFLKSSIHRVVAPPPDQAHIDRLGVLYFVRPENDLELKPVESKVLKKLGYEPGEDAQAVKGITAGQWVKARVKRNVDPGDVKEHEVIKGIKAKFYD